MLYNSAWRWIFHNGSRSPFVPRFLPGLAEKTLASLVSLLAPGECRMCGTVLRSSRRAPYCDPCLASPAPMSADYFCARCRTPFLTDRPLDDNGVCRLCLSGVAAYDFAYSFGYYEGALLQLLHDFKYQRMDGLAEPLGELLTRAIPLDLRADVIVPVPLHWRRRMWRGFNQCELLAKPVARRLGIPVARALRKSRATEMQAKLTPSQRRSNLTGAFVLARPDAVKGKRVLLVDDVLTTGATAVTCSAVLRRGGAKSVTVLTLARVDRRPGTGLMGATLAQAAAGGANYE